MKRYITICLLIIQFASGDKLLPNEVDALIVPSASATTFSDGLIASPEQGWPQWRGPRRDGISDEKGLLSSWPQNGPKLLWKIDNLGKGWSSPIIVGRQLFITGEVGDDLVIFAFDRIKNFRVLS